MPVARFAELTAEFDGITSPYCRSEEEINTIKASLKITLIEDGISSCLKRKQCEIKFFECKHEGSLLKVKFTLTQTFDLKTADIITRDVTKFESQDFSIQYDDDNVQKRATVITEKATNKNTDTVTKCGSSQLLNPSQFCISCGTGFGNSNGVCQTCGFGYYSDTIGVLPCTKCQDSETTLAVRSEKAEDCVATSTICIVPEAPTDGALTPTSKSRVDEGSDIAVICMEGFGTSFTEQETFKCASGITVPSCHSKIRYGLYSLFAPRII